MSTTEHSPRLVSEVARGLTVSMLAIQCLVIGVYIGLVILPFVANGLHQEPANMVVSGRFDPKALWPYRAAPFLSGIALFVHTAGMLLTAGAALCGLVLLLARWTPLGRAGRLRVTAVMLLAAGFASFVFSPTGVVIGTWLAD
jgi:hypothetical protein